MTKELFAVVQSVRASIYGAGILTVIGVEICKLFL